MSMLPRAFADLALALFAATLCGCITAPATEQIAPALPAAGADDGATPAGQSGRLDLASSETSAPAEPRVVTRLLTYLYSAAGNPVGLPESHGLVAPPIHSTPGPVAASPPASPEDGNLTQTRSDSALKLVDETLRYSAKSGAAAVIVDKSKFRLYLVQQGRVTADYPIELGANPVDDKRMEGDMTTPEGLYHVVEKRDHNQTKYYRGFLLDYPNATDRAEFRRLKQNGDIPADATIGGGIMLHGLGSGMAPGAGGENWTHGCVALSNADIDAAFPFIAEGTRVVIVPATGW